MSRIDQIEQLLKRLVALTPDLEGAILVTLDGLPIASALAGGADEDRVAAMGAAALPRWMISPLWNRYGSTMCRIWAKLRWSACSTTLTPTTDGFPHFHRRFP